MTFKKILDQIAEVREPVRENVGGIVRTTWQAKYADIPVFLASNNGLHKVMNENLNAYTIGQFTLYCEAKYEITEEMQVVVEGKIYEITLVQNLKKHHLEIQLNLKK